MLQAPAATPWCSSTGTSLMEWGGKNHFAPSLRVKCEVLVTGAWSEDDRLSSAVTRLLRCMCFSDRYQILSCPGSIKCGQMQSSHITKCLLQKHPPENLKGALISLSAVSCIGRLRCKAGGTKLCPLAHQPPSCLPPKAAPWGDGEGLAWCRAGPWQAVGRPGGGGF